MTAHGPVPPVLVLRHGESTANVQGLIVSLPGPRALTEVGLTARGRAQAREAAREGLARGLGPQTVVLTSDFGHDGFLIESEPVGQHLARLLDA